MIDNSKIRALVDKAFLDKSSLALYAPRQTGKTNCVCKTIANALKSGYSKYILLFGKDKNSIKTLGNYINSYIDNDDLLTKEKVLNCIDDSLFYFSNSHKFREDIYYKPADFIYVDDFEFIEPSLLYEIIENCSALEIPIIMTSVINDEFDEETFDILLSDCCLDLEITKLTGKAIMSKEDIDRMKLILPEDAFRREVLLLRKKS